MPEGKPARIELEGLELMDVLQSALMQGQEVNVDAPHAASLLSIAVGLKRIADAVCGDETHLGLVDAVGNSIYSAIVNSKA